MTQQEMFRFLSVRAPRRVTDAKARRLFPRAADLAVTPFLEAVAALERDDQVRRRGAQLARTYMDRPAYVADPEGRDEAFAEVFGVRDRLIAAGAAPDGADLRREIEPVVGEPLGRFVDGPRFRELKVRFWDSLFAQALAPAARPEDREDIVTGVRMLHAMEVLADKSNDDAVMAWTTVRTLTPVLPRALILVPQEAPGPGSAGGSGGGSGAGPGPGTARPPEQPVLDAIARFDAALADVRAVRRRLLPIGRGRAGPDRDIVTRVRALIGGGRDDRATEAEEHGLLPTSSGRARARTIDDGELAEDTRKVLTELRLDLTRMTVPEVIEALEAEVSRQTGLLYAMVRVAIGQPDPWFPGLSTGRDPAAGDTEPLPYRVLGVGDLEIVRETLLRYEDGEVAHVENVMRTETRRRTHEWLRETEETFTVETDRTEEVERDLQSTERFELQRETERTIETDISVEAGVTTSGKYGLVEVTTSGNFAYSEAKSESDRTSSTFARDITERSVQRISERVRAERVRRTREQIKESNSHGFDNREGPGHVRGIYQWLDKVYQAQVVNYGRRLMLEFIVPEPAALYRVPTPEVATDDQPARPPDPVVPVVVPGRDGSPELLRDRTGRIVTRPLAPGDLHGSNYQHFVAAYGVQDATPPPPDWVFIGAGVANERKGTEDPEELEWSAKVVDTLVVPDGWRAIGGWAQATSVQPHRDGDAVDGENILTIGGRIVDAGGAPSPLDPNIHLPSTFSLDDVDVPHEGRDVDHRGLTGSIPLTTRFNAPYYTVAIEILCERTDEKFTQWQLGTFASIMTAYEGRLQAYRDSRRRSQALTEITGRNPLRNAQIVRDELKRSCITLMSGQRFDTFNAVSIGAPFGLPEIDRAEVAEESGAIQFLEQAFEWSQMTFLLYPYFWGRKAHWLTTRALDDVDPAFADFLRAGAARVIVPVRPAYETQVPVFLESDGQIPDVGDDLTLEGDLFVSIVEELRSRQGAHVEQGPGTVDLVQGDRRVTGSGTAFDADHDVDREIELDGTVHRIQEVVGPTELRLTAPYEGASVAGLRYGLGPQLVGLPWLVRVPTSLVYLSEDTAPPDWTAERER